MSATLFSILINNQDSRLILLKIIKMNDKNHLETSLKALKEAFINNKIKRKALI